MAYNNNLITAPVSINDVQKALATSTNSLKGLCIHPNINKWSRRKPIKSSEIFKSGAKHWRLSTGDTNSRVRNGFEIGGYNDVWQYNMYDGGNPGTVPYRLADFEGYCHSVPTNYELIRTNFPNTFIAGQPYTATMLAWGYDEGEDLNSGAVRLPDVFLLESKYCCVAVRLENSTTNTVLEKYSARLPETGFLIGGQVEFSASEINNLIGAGGIITAAMFLIEADSFNGTTFVNRTDWSIKVKPETFTSFVNSQWLPSGFIICTSYAPQCPVKTGYKVSNTNQYGAFVEFSSYQKTGGLISGYYFRARSLGGNQLGPNYVHQIPDYTIGSNASYKYNIPVFQIDLLDNREATIEYSTWQGHPDNPTSTLVESHIFKFENDIEVFVPSLF